MAQTPEGRVKNQIKKLLKERGAWFFMPVQTGFSAPGIPDIICCYRAFTVTIEAKAGKNKPTKAQEFQMKKLREEGGAVTLVINEHNQCDISNAFDDIDLFWDKVERLLGEKVNV